jgi:16S rRNA processing protein RimM
VSGRPAHRISVGRIVGVYGVRGWVKVHSDTRPREAILDYTPWLIERGGQWEAREVEEGRTHGKGIVARLSGCVDRDQAAGLIGAEIAVERAQLPETASHEYYWAELEGLKVVNLEGRELGTVSHLFETGANDVMVVRGERERLIPFAKPAIQQVDLGRSLIVVDWDVED